jgi:hypothetical protein
LRVKKKKKKYIVFNVAWQAYLGARIALGVYCGYTRGPVVQLLALDVRDTEEGATRARETDCRRSSANGLVSRGVTIQ